MAKAALVKGGILMSPINKHIHLSVEEIKQYIYAENELTQSQIEHIELELQVCEKCSDLYVNILENMEFNVKPKLTDEGFDHLLTAVAEQDASKVDMIPKNKKWYEHSIVHIAIAASITGLLFISGLLSMMTNVMNAEPEFPYEAKQEINKEVNDWLNLSEQQWYKQFQQSMKHFELFKEEK